MHVVLALNESEASQYALSWAIKNVLAGGKHRATVLTVVEPPVQLGYYYTEKAAGFMEEVNEEAQKAARKVCEKHVQAVRDGAPDTAVDLVVVEGEDARDAVVDFVNAQAALSAAAVDREDVLLLVGSRGMGQLKRAFVGSTSDYCIHHCACPVLVVKKPH